MKICIDILVCIFISCFIFLLGVGLGVVGIEETYQKQAIEQGCASYDSVTGEWGWNLRRE